MAKKRKSSNVTLRYPNQPIGSDYDYMRIDIVEYNPNQSDLLQRGFFGFSLPDVTSSVGRSRTSGSIILPMPDGLSDQNSVNWTSDSLTSIDAKIFSTLSGVVEGANIEKAISELESNNESVNIGSVLGKLGSNITSSLAGDARDGVNALRDPQIQNALKTKYTAAAANLLSANIDPKRIISRTTGQVLNPNMELLFDGVNLRQFDFSYTLTPRDSGEGNACKGIINTFKRRMAAKKSASGGGDGIFISAPDVFNISFKSGAGDHPFLFKMKPCALKAMSVNYMDGTPHMTYDDATPVKMRLNLQFQELVPVYAEDYQDSTNDGVGF